MPDEDEEDARVAVWLFFVGGDKRPVKVPMDYGVLAALRRKNPQAWSAVLEYVQGHINSRYSEEY